MRITRTLWQHRQPMISFIGKRRAPPAKIDHTPHVHPASPAESLPESFASYRSKAQQYGPLGDLKPQPQSSAAPSGSAAAQSADPYGAIGGHSAKELGPIQPGKGEFWDRNELPARFRRTPWTEAEIEAVESGGASAAVGCGGA